MLTNLFFLGLVGQVAATPETFVALNMSDRTYCAAFTTQIEGQLKLNNDNETSTYNWKMGGNDSHALDFCSAKSDRGLDANVFLIPFDQPEITPDSSFFVAAEGNKTEPWIAIIGFVIHPNGSYELEHWALIVQPSSGIPLVNALTLKQPQNVSGVMLGAGADGYSCAEVRLPLENGSVMVFKNMQVAAFESFRLSKLLDGLEFVDFKHLLLISSLTVLIGAFAAVVVACAFVGVGVVLYKRHLERTAGYADL